MKHVIKISILALILLAGSTESFCSDIQPNSQDLRSQLQEIKDETEKIFTKEWMLSQNAESPSTLPSEEDRDRPASDEKVTEAGAEPPAIIEDETVNSGQALKKQSAETQPQTAPTGTIPETKSVPESPRDADLNTDIREQDIPSIIKNHQIEKDLKEARSITVNITKPIVVVPTEPVPTATLEDTLQDMIKPELRQSRVDLNFDKINLGDVLLTLGQSAAINIVLDPSLKNNVLDLHLKNVTISETLLLIANSYSLGFKRVGDSLFISSKEKLRSENLLTKIFKLRNISVEEARVLIKDLVDAANASTEINSIMVVGDSEQLARVEKIIKQIDIPQPQVILEAKIIEISKDALKDLGVDWSDSLTLSYQESGRPVEFSNVENAPGSPVRISSIARNPLQFNTIIRMLENQNKAKVLSNPRIATLNDKEAEIFVGDRIPYTVTTISGGVATSDVRFEEPGIRLNITPSIIEENFVVIKIQPEVSFIYTYRGPNDAYPQTRKREATAYVRIKNNEPFVIGGLLNQEDKRNLYKVPILGNIPLIGNLFSYESHTVFDTELIITVVPTIVYEGI